jgi:hypothetical protein
MNSPGDSPRWRWRILILEESGGAHEPRLGQVSLGGGEPRPEKSAHERTWKHPELPAQRAHRGETRRGDEERLEESPAFRVHAGQVESELRERLALNLGAAATEQQPPELVPSLRIADVDELRDTRRAQGEGDAGRVGNGRRHERDGGDAREFAHHRADARLGRTIAAGDRHQNRVSPFRLDVAYELRHAVAVDRPVRAHPCRVDARALGRGEKGGNSQERAFWCSRLHAALRGDAVMGRASVFRAGHSAVTHTALGCEPRIAGAR